MSPTMLEAPPEHKDDLDLPESLMEEIDCPKGFEYVDDQLRKLNVSNFSSFIAGRICTKLSIHSDGHNSGWVFPEGTSFRCFPNNPRKIYRPDTAFHQLHRLTSHQVQTGAHVSIVPDIVVEVISPNDKAYMVNAKRLEWLSAGAQLVWIIYPDEQEVHVYRADGTTNVLSPSASLSGEGLLPGFSLPVAELFRLPALATGIEP